MIFILVYPPDFLKSQNGNQQNIRASLIPQNIRYHFVLTPGSLQWFGSFENIRWSSRFVSSFKETTLFHTVPHLLLA